MRHLTRRDAEAQRLLERARTIAIVGAGLRLADPGRVALEYLRGAGFDVVPIRPDRAPVAGLKSFATPAEVPGRLDLVVVYRWPGSPPDLIEATIAKGADAIWLAEAARHGALARQARAAGLTVVAERDIVEAHRHRLREAGEPPKLGAEARRRGRRRREGHGRGYAEAGGGGRQGGGGRRAALDEKKMARQPAPRRR